MQNKDIPEDDDLSLKEIVLTIKDYYTYLKSKAKYIAICVAAGALLGIAYASLKTPTYIASLSYAVEDGKSGGGGLSGLASSFGLNVGGGGNSGAFAGNNLMELYKSRAMVEQALLAPVAVNNQSLSLAEYYIQDKNWREDWQEEEPDLNQRLKFPPLAKRAAFTRSQDSVLGLIYKQLSENHLSVEQKDQDVAIGTISLTHPDEYFAQQFTLALTSTVTDFYVETKSKRSKENLDILEHQTDSVRTALNQSIKGAAVAQDNTFGLNPAYNVKRVPSAKEQVDVQANTAILQELVKQTELAKVSLRKQTPLIQVIDSPILPLEKEETSLLKSIVIGGFIAGILVVGLFIGYREYKKAME